MSGSIAGGYAGFPTTHWSLVELANVKSSDAQREALARLIQLYLPALKSYLMQARRMPPDQADDVLHEFVARKVLEDELVGHADRARGKFRTFLITALNNFYVSQLRAEHARTRRPAGSFIPSDQCESEVTDPGVRPGDAFERDWARTVLSRAVDWMREECRASARQDVWGVFEARVLHPALDEGDPVPYSELVTRFGFASPSQASNVLVTATRMFARVLKQVIGQYECDPDAIDQEIADLREILSRGRARSG